MTPDGMYAVSLAGGSTRWVSACELIAASEHGLSDAEREPRVPAGTLVGIAPPHGIASSRWLSAALVAPASSSKGGGGAAAPAGSVALRRPASQKPLTLRVPRGADGRYGIGVDDENRVALITSG